tara:strand:+ start:4692 stop:5444 length:753 start_codon:yes stop_codon:yes gene_type:complete
MFTSFYNEAIRKVVIGFGSLFNDIKIIRKNSDGSTKESIRVPLSYGPKEKYIRRIQQMSSISDTTKVQITLPTMGFNITGIAYDPARKTNKLRQTRYQKSDGNVEYNYNETPYNISFGLYAFSRNMDDNLQIIEQITPYFSPEFIVTVKQNNINSKVDIPIVLNGIDTVEEYEGDFDTRRNITTSFEFTAKTYVYSPVKTSSIILDSYADIHGSLDALIGDAQLIRAGATGTTGATAGANVYGGVTYDYS